MDGADQIAALCIALMIPIVAAIVWAWWKDGQEEKGKSEED